MQNKIIFYEPIELQDTFSIEDSKFIKKIKNNIKNLEVCVIFEE